LSQILTKNNAPLKCPSLDEVDAVEIGKIVFGIELSNIDGLAFIKSDTRGPGFNFRLKRPIIVDEFKLANFNFQLGEDKYTGKFYIPLGPPPTLGDQVIVTIKRTGFALTEEQLYEWLNIFGKIEGELRYKYYSRLPTIKDDYAEVVMRMTRHIPFTLPAYGKKIQILYRGQPIQCSKCYELGHIRKECKASTNNWLGYVKSLLEKGYIPEKLFGMWIDYLRAHERVVNTKFDD